MKTIGVLFCLLTVMGGIASVLYRGDSSPSKNSASHSVQRPRGTEPVPPLSTEAVTPVSTSAKKKECGCCRSTLEKIKQKRQALEMWARETIRTYGYEDGMKRVTAKSVTLAKRMQVRLEKEKNSINSVQQTR